MEKRTITVLGSTGSVGVSALEVIARHTGYYRVFALTAQRNIELLAAQCARFHPDYAVVADPARLGAAQALMPRGRTQLLAGAEALKRVAAAPCCDTVLAGISGSAGLASTLAAVRAGKRVLLANKEALVMAGALLMDSVEESGAVLLPVDSEHNAVFQCLWQAQPVEVEKIILTASGGPFLDTPIESLATVTPEQACAHPNWDMGVKISVDSATMMNKGLEVIEACRLFGLPPDKVEVVVHPQSVLHAMVAFRDGSVLTQMSRPDMRVPISYALAWPERISSGVDTLDIRRCRDLQLREVDHEKFPSVALAYRCMRAGDTAIIALNAANEVAVEAFVAGRLRYDRIVTVVQAVVDKTEVAPVADIEEVIAADARAREAAHTMVQSDLFAPVA